MLYLIKNSSIKNLKNIDLSDGLDRLDFESVLRALVDYIDNAGIWDVTAFSKADVVRVVSCCVWYLYNNTEEIHDVDAMGDELYTTMRGYLITGTVSGNSRSDLIATLGNVPFKVIM